MATTNKKTSKTKTTSSKKTKTESSKKGTKKKRTKRMFSQEDIYNANVSILLCMAIEALMLLLGYLIIVNY